MVAGTSYAPTGSAAGPRIADVYGLMNQLPARRRSLLSRDVWMAALGTINALGQLPKFTGSTSSMVGDHGPAPTMLGRPRWSPPQSSPPSTKVLAFLDATVDRIGVQVIYDPLVLGATRRPTGQGAY